MADDLQTLETQLAALRNMRASGVLESEFEQGGSGQRRRVKFRSDAELADAINDLERRIRLLTRPQVQVIYPSYRKGV